MSETRSEYRYHSPTPEQLAVMEQLRQAYSDLHTLIERLLPEGGRYRSLALTTLETAAFWTNKAIVLGREGNRT